MIGWIAIVVLAAAFAVGFVVLFRSMRRWHLPAPESPEAKDAAERLDSLAADRPGLAFRRPRSRRGRDVDR